MSADLRCDIPCDDDCEADCHQAHLPIHKRRPDMCRCIARTDLRNRYAEAIRAAADYAILGEWICCDPVKPDHDLCVKGDTARQMLRAVLADDPEKLFLPSGVTDALMAVRDEELERLRALVAHYENTITWETTCHGCAAQADSAIRETERAEKAEAAAARARALHPSREEADAAQSALCVECCQPAPCATRRALDGDES